MRENEASADTRSLSSRGLPIAKPWGIPGGSSTQVNDESEEEEAEDRNDLDVCENKFAFTIDRRQERSARPQRL